MTGLPLSDGVRETLNIFLGPQPFSVLEAGCGQAVANGRLVRCTPAFLPFCNASFDRIYCVNTLHSFADRARFFAEARRLLRPGGRLMTVDKDPHTDRDDWWAYDYFEGLRELERERFARVRTLRGEMALAGFAWTESMEADRLEVVTPAAEALTEIAAERSPTSPLALLTADAVQRGVEKLRQANDAAGGALQLVSDIRLYATMGWAG